MHISKFERFGGWLLQRATSVVWSGVLLAVLVTAVLVSGDLTTSQAASLSAALSPGKPVNLPASTNVSLDKQASPTRVLNGGLVVYTVVLTNSGELSATVGAITDTLDSSLTFVEMTTGADPQVNGDQLVWPDDFEVPAGEAVTLEYKVQTSAAPGWSWPRNKVEASVDGEILTAGTVVEVGPEKDYAYFPITFKSFRYAYLSVAKSVSPTTVNTNPGQVVTYTVTIKNEGDTTGTLLTVDDTLPAGFTFQRIATGSDVVSNPAGTTGTITWSGPWTMSPGQQIRLIYRVTASQTEGVFTNSARVTASKAFVQPDAAAAAVTVEPAVLLEEHFDHNIDRWTPFLNYWRLAPGQWYWGAHDGFDGSGGATQNSFAVDDKEAEDGLLMYLGQGSQNWADYRVETKLILRTINYPHGLWVRGQYQDVGKDDTAGWTTGYYIVVGGGVDSGRHYVSLRQLQTLTDCWGNACDNPQNLYDFNNSHELTTTKVDGKLQRDRWYTLTVEVRGNHIQAWLDGVLYIDYVDEKEPFLTGTVGLKTYKADTVSFDDVIVTPLQ